MQYLDDLDDIYGAVGLIAEKLRNVALFLALLLLAAIVGAAGIVLALAKPDPDVCIPPVPGGNATDRDQDPLLRNRLTRI
jgi:hypothetical protein